MSKWIMISLLILLPLIGYAETIVVCQGTEVNIMAERKD